MTAATRIVLVIEDDLNIRRVVRTLLELEPYRVLEAATAAAGLAAARTCKPDLIILDLGLPDRDGMTLIEAIRAFSTLPILVLSARSAEADRVAALEAGADDYLVKPFGARELLARVRVALRHAVHVRRGEATGTVLRIGQWRIDLQARRSCDEGGRELHLTPIEYRLLEVLGRHAGLVVTHRALLRQVWGPGSGEQRQYLRVYIKHLRTKLEPDPTRPRWLLTETGVGYRLIEP